MIELTTNPIDPVTLLNRVQSTAAGAMVLVLGTTREITGSRQTASLDTR